MKMIKFFMSLVLILVSACVFASSNGTDNGTTIFTTEITNSTSFWPAINHGYVYYAASKISSEDEAISIIRSSQGYVTISGRKPYDIIADKYSAVFKIQWTEETVQQEDVPTTGGFFIGWDYIPTYSNTVQTYHNSEQKQDSMTVQFKDIKAVYFYKNYLCIRYDSETGYIGAENSGRLKTLADAVYTMALRNGAKIEQDLLFEIVHLSPAQSKMLDIEGGDMITSVFENSEADKAGLKEGDVLLNLQEIGDSGGLQKFFASGKSVSLVRFGQKGSIINYNRLKIRLKGVK
jgi:hypothetical protein